ncbi:unnamed protein product [Parascedosporium putredinis]|uniref:Uncharacterized protein n=1 Tax=Parascedosporium putredinis TaxID=1442378 RepID=A0A9P1M7L1_9PEZI|nr:unnamed protein product [Parascedosporium putredinis]CAI7991878.1 unnamed protein product [Parascedosporium putredinis]
MPSFTSVLTSHSTDCEAGLSYFKCGTNDGCFAKDPCTGPSDQTASSCNPNAKATHLEPSVIHDIFPTQPDLATGPATGVHLETYADKSQVEQVLAFTGIPKDAKSCSFNWKQGDRIERIFIAVSYNSVKPFDTAKAEFGGADFTNWDTLGDDTHGVGVVDCAESLYFKVALRNAKGETSIYLNQNESNGYYVSYTC